MGKHFDGRLPQRDGAEAMTQQNYDVLLINGQWQQSNSREPLQVISPSTENVIGTVPNGDSKDVESAVAAARRSFDTGPWRKHSIEQRAAILERALDLLEGQIEDVADLVSSEMGLPTSVSRKKTPGAIWAGRYFLETALAEETVDVRKTLWGPAAVIKEPVGVVASIAPWNSPFNMAISKIFPALVTGCSVVYKPSPDTPLDAYIIAKALVGAGLPEGVFNLVTGDADTGRWLVEHPDVDKVSFTGSTGAGRQIAASAGQRFARLQLELGGKSAAIVLDDADPAKTLQGIIAGSFANSGQVCSAYSRILVPSASTSTWTDVVVAAGKSFRVGDPFDPLTTMGPLVSRVQRDRVLGYIQAGLSEGAHLALGGGIPTGLDKGFYVEPTVFTGATNAMRISREEIFGPVVTVMPYDSLDEAIDIANDSDYGLHGAVFTEDPERALYVARSVRSGTFSINSYTHNVQAPFGGVKDSGIGREMAAEGINAYYELKTINLTDATFGALTN
ncbi:aldehyde dehydrogenase [Paenarthrobacter sp. YAF11_1]|uniref:aldehyde dehydrogenase n=1 Tax=Paenarthrobacter sp. YAF11_1 TaxID=3233074 RepID=UPI003F9A42C4